MRFTESEIQMAARLRGAGMVWAPHAGHYVFEDAARAFEDELANFFESHPVRPVPAG